MVETVNAEEKIADAAQQVAEAESDNAESVAAIASATVTEQTAQAAETAVAAANAAAALATAQAASANQQAAETVNKVKGDLSWLQSHVTEQANFSQEVRVAIPALAERQTKLEEGIASILAGMASLTRPPSTTQEAVNPDALPGNQEGQEGQTTSQGQTDPAKPKHKKRII